ncbi:MAG: glycosyltransferase family 2 protein [Rhodospirillaceae bacterium]|nr:glycosyltransferase family 2 protein [Rhodospirillaceae bacterium]
MSIVPAATGCKREALLFISVVVPSFNRPKSTLRAVRSALSQTFAPIEVIVVDDASDPPLDPQRFHALDSRVAVHRLAQNSGAAAARQRGIDCARGELIAFLDSDDLWEPEKLARQVRVLSDAGSGPVAVSCGWRERAPDGEVRRARVPVDAVRPVDFISGCWFCPGSTVILPRALFAEIGPFDARLRRLEDLDWFARFGLADGRLLVVPQVLAEIEIGRRARCADVDPAVETILGKPIWREALDGSGQRALRAWLDVERGRAFLNDGRWIRAGLYLARSFARVPRMRIQLRDWWDAVL